MGEAGTGGFVLIAGPDGAGKSTVVEAIAARGAVAGLRISRAHHRPGLIAGRPEDAGPVTDPHSRPPRSILASLAKLAVVFCDHLAGGHTRWRAQRRAGLLLLERGWFDMVVDPRRYRLPTALVPLIRLLGRLLPQPDVVLLLTGDAEALHARKPEIGITEVDQQIRRWRDIAPVTARHVLEVDTVRTSPEQAADALLAALPRAGRQWRSVPLTPSRVALRTTGAARPALAIYQPQSLRARAGAAVAYRAITIPGRRVPEPLPHLDDLWEMLGLHPDGIAAMRSSTPGRVLLSVCRDGRMDAVVKVGPADDATLQNEAAMLTAPTRPDLPLRRPQVIWTGEWQGHVVLVTRAAQRSCKARWTPHQVVPLAQALATAGPDGAPVTHGDLAPWNLVRTVDGPVLLDWESARWADEPLHDLAHFVVQAGALLGRYGPEQAVSLLCGEDSPGRQLLAARGRDATEARPLLEFYLAGSQPTEPRAIRFRHEMLRMVTT